MAKQVDWNRRIVNVFIEEAMLSPVEIQVLETRVKGMPISRQAQELNMSESSVNRIVAGLKKKYDNVQQYHPELPKRRVSKEEMYMDNN